MNSELEQKTERITRMLAAENLGGVLMNTQHNFSWLTCGGSNGIDLSRENGAGFLFVAANGKRYVIANNIEMSRLLSEELGFQKFEPIEISWRPIEISWRRVTHRGIAGGHAQWFQRTKSKCPIIPVAWRSRMWQ